MLGRFLESFLESEAAEKGAAQTTLSAYEQDLRQFLEFTKIDQPKDLNEEIIEKFIQNLQTEDYAAKSLARKLSSIKDFCKFLYSEKIIENNPAAYILTPKQEKPLPKFLTVAEIKLLIETAFAKTDYRYWRIGVMIELMYATGLRVSELVGLPENAINYKKGLITIFGKGSKERRIQIGNDAVIRILKEYQNEFRNEISKCRHFFANQNGKTLSDQSVRRMIRKYCALASIEMRITPHMFRHTFATSLLEADVDIRYIQEMLGHSSINITEIYTHVAVAKQREILASKHPRKDFRI